MTHPTACRRRAAAANTVLAIGDPLYEGWEEFKAKVEDGRAGPSHSVTVGRFSARQCRAVVVEGGRLTEFVPEFAMTQGP